MAQSITESNAVVESVKGKGRKVKVIGVHCLIKHLHIAEEL
jgi:hypothetical protein